MKKFLLTLIVLFLSNIQILASENNNVLNLHTKTSYILQTTARAVNIKNTNPEIVTAESVTNIDESDSSILFTTKQEGIAYITFKQKNKELTLKLLIDDRADESQNLIKLDLIEDKQ